MATSEPVSMTPAAALARHLEWLEYALTAAREEQDRRRGRLDKATSKNRERRTVRLAEVTAEVDELAALVQGIKDIQAAATAAKPAAGSGSKAPAARRRSTNASSTKASSTKRATATKRATTTKSAATRRSPATTGRRGPRRAAAPGTKPAAAPADTTAATNGTGPAAAPKPPASSSPKRTSAAKKPAASPKAPATRTRRSSSRRTGSSS